MRTTDDDHNWVEVHPSPLVFGRAGKYSLRLKTATATAVQLRLMLGSGSLTDVNVKITPITE